MEYRFLDPSFLTTLLILCIRFSAASDRTCIDQLNSFKREVRDDLNFLNTNVGNLFKSVKEIKIALQSSTQTYSQDTKNNSSLDSVENSAGNSSVRKENIAMDEGCVRVNVSLIKDFKSEKRANQKLSTRLQTVENIISGIIKDMETFQTLIYNRNDTSKEGDAIRPIDKEADLIDKVAINGYKEIKTTDTVTVTTNTVTEESKPVTETTNAVIETTNAVSETTNAVTETKRKICADTNGVFGIYLKSLGIERSIYCDGYTDGGDWVVIMRRQDGSVDFERDWNDYKNGFGDVEGELWIGNDVLHELTKYKPVELRIDMEDYGGNKAYAKYKRFQVGSEAEKYVLTVTGYSGTAGDSLHKVEHPGGIHNGNQFSTFDSDNDRYDRENCAETYPGGWWFNMCFRSHLTGKYGRSVEGHQGIIWHTWLGWYDYLKFVDMKIR